MARNFAEEQARRLIDELVKDAHQSLKWAWQIVMGFALKEAIEKLYISWTAASPSPAWGEPIKTSMLFFTLVFLPTFIRFFYGDNRYLDLHYLDRSPYDYGEVLDLRLPGHRRFTDLLLLISQGGIFIFLSEAIAEPLHFVRAYAALLLINIFWLSLTIFLNQYRHRTAVPARLRDAVTGNAAINARLNSLLHFDRRDSKDAAPVIWIVNNLFCLFVLAVLLTLKIRPALFYGGFILASLVNSGIDFWLTWSFYFPNLSELYGTAIKQYETIPAPD